MKRLITLLIISFAAPSLASATCLGYKECWATSGSMVISAGVNSTSLTAHGHDFDMSGLFSWYAGAPPLYVGVPIPDGTYIGFPLEFDTSLPLNTVSIDVRGGVHLDSTSDDNVANVLFESPLVAMPGPGTYSEPFSFRTFFGQGISCFSSSGVPCWSFYGQGTFTIDVGATDTPGLGVIREATFTFNKPVFTPEPSTASLLLIALGALGFQAWARMRREQLGPLAVKR